MSENTHKEKKRGEFFGYPWWGWLLLFLIIYSVFSSFRESSSSSSKEECDYNYSGCLTPGMGDYDCRGGSGDGPNYTGRVKVVGTDVYGLDRDGDGIACE